MNSLKHITAYIAGGLASVVFMIPLSIFTNLSSLEIGIGCMLTVWFPVYFFLSKLLIEVE